MKLNLGNPIDSQKAVSYFNKLQEKKSRIELKEFRETRSLNQNAYLHICVQYFAQETGYTLEESKVEIKREYGLYYTKNAKKFLRSTADLDTGEMTAFIDWIRAFCLDQFGCYIPTSEEYLANQFEIEKQLQHIK